MSVHGGVKVYRGNAAAARSYVEADRSRVDDYYLAEGTGLADRYVAEAGSVRSAGSMSGDAYEAWVAGYDPDTLEPRGRLRHDDKAVRFVEVVVNGPKTWSLAAALDPIVAAAYDRAQDKAASQIIGWLSEHATTRMGPRGRQVQVPVERIEAAVIRHYTSRAGDPHRHLHVQINARVFARGKWRGLHTVGVRDSIDAINGIGHAAVIADPEFRRVLAERGFTLDPQTGEVQELSKFAGSFSARARQIGRNVERYETEWREAHPGREPGPDVSQAWDRRAWAEARPDKVVPADGTVLTDRWVEELHRLGYQSPDRSVQMRETRIGTLDRDTAVAAMMSRIGAKRSAWNAADIRGQAEQLIARSGVVADAAVRIELAEDLTARAVATCLPLLDSGGAPEHIRALTSREVVAVEEHITSSFAFRAGRPGLPTIIGDGGGLDESQLAAVATLAGDHELVVVEGPAGAGKTATLATTRDILDQSGRRMVVVTPTLKAAQVAAADTGARAYSAAWLARQYGFTWDDDGKWTRIPSVPAPSAVLDRGDLLLVDEAGMLDQDTAGAVMTIANETGARLALVGDRHQLPAVGRGGVLDLATRWVAPDAHLALDTVHRFADPEYAQLSLAMRTGHDPIGVFDQLIQRGQIVLHPDEQARTSSLAEDAAATGALVVADTREQVADLNHAIREHLIAAGVVHGQRAVITDGGERIGVGDKVTTRRNDYDLGVANHDLWTVTAISQTALGVVGKNGTRTLPAEYANRHVELAYASTIYAAQGETTQAAHLVLGETTGAAAAYVAMTRGRQNNTAHLIADDVVDARDQWARTFARDRADLGPAHAAKLAAMEAADYEPYFDARSRPTEASLGRRHHEDHGPTVRTRSGPGVGF